MPIPFLIAGAVAAAAAVAYALSDDDKPSSSSDSDEVVRRRKEAAEEERKERERTQKRAAAHEDFQKEGRIFGKNLAQAVPSDLVEVSSGDAFTLDFDLKKGILHFDMEEASRRDSHLFAAINSLETILTKRASHQKTIENLATFSELYKPEFQYGTALQKKEAQVARINDNIEILKKIKAQLLKLESETASA